MDESLNRSKDQALSALIEVCRTIALLTELARELANEAFDLPQPNEPPLVSGRQARTTRAPTCGPIAISADDLAGLVGMPHPWPMDSDGPRFEIALSPGQQFVVRLLHVVATDYKAPLPELVGRGRAQNVTTARQVAMWLLRTETTMGRTDIAQLFQMSASTVGGYLSTIRMRLEHRKGEALHFEHLAHLAHDLCRDAGP